VATTITASRTGRRSPWWQKASWIGLIVLGAFNVFAAVADLAATAGTGLPSDHTGTFADVAGRTWASFKAAQPGAAHYVTLVERGYALHELTFAILFLIIVVIPPRAGQRWAWWACWAVLIAYLGYTLHLRRPRQHHPGPQPHRRHNPAHPAIGPDARPRPARCELIPEPARTQTLGLGHQPGARRPARLALAAGSGKTARLRCRGSRG